MNQHGFLYVTASHLEEAKKLAKICLNKKLAACVNIFPSVLSFYSWKGEEREDAEVILIIKTREDLFEDLCSLIKENHSYDCPCLVFLPFSNGTRDFLSWMDSQLKDKTDF